MTATPPSTSIGCKVRCVTCTSNEGAKGSISGRGIAMAAEEAWTCYRCCEKRHYVRSCKDKDSNNRTSTGTHGKKKNKESSNNRQDPKMQLITSGILYTGLPKTTSISRRSGPLHPENTTPVAERRRSHCLCCTEREFFSGQRRR